jgi:hypothetical protein
MPWARAAMRAASSVGFQAPEEGRMEGGGGCTG